MRLMIVDDSNIIRTRISRVVQRPELSHLLIVGLARNGAEAVEIAERSRPEIVTMDLTMPEMDGVECTQELIDMFPDINILVISALSDKATAIAALRVGARGFLPKPFTDDELSLALLDIMDTDTEGEV